LVRLTAKPDTTYYVPHTTSEAPLAVRALEEPITRARILIIDDQSANVRLLERLLGTAGYHQVYSTTDPRTALDLWARVEPDLIILDLHMPHLDGFAVIDQLLATASGRYLPILVLTADDAIESRQRALRAGARDFLQKPFDAVEALLRIRNLLVTRFLHLRLEREKLGLEETVRERTRRLEAARLEMLERLARAAEYRDDNTGEHSRRVGRMARRIAQTLGWAPPECDLIERAAPLHDVGKIGIPDAVLMKTGPLTAVEFEVMKAHTTIGARILSGSHGELLKQAEAIAGSHHERWDGRGYPHGLTGAAIPIAGRIAHVADAFDAMTHARPYKAALSEADARDEIARGASTEYDPDVVEAFLTAQVPA
jgi:putative two-component system response regulator